MLSRMYDKVIEKVLWLGIYQRMRMINKLNHKGACTLTKHMLQDKDFHQKAFSLLRSTHVLPWTPKAFKSDMEIYKALEIVVWLRYTQLTQGEK